MQRAQSNPPPPPLPPSPTLEWKVRWQSKTPSKGLQSIRAVVLLSVVVSIIVAGVFSLPWIVSSFMIGGATIASDSSIYSDLSGVKKLENLPASPTPKPPPRPPPPLPPPTPSIIPFTCPEHNQTNAHICSSIPPISTPESPIISSPAAPSCPEYFRWIHEDLQPWRRTGITREMVERAGRTANFRLVVLGGRAFVQRFRPSFQTRDVFTLWGVVQLLRRYPGQLPDLELMFDTVDWPVVRAADYPGRNASAAAPPPLFRYCGDDSTLDIVFPDWSFWGWPEINIKPWEKMRDELKEANKGKKWTEREPYAYWKGNPAVSSARQDLLRCNISESVDWNARIYTQDWRSEALSGYKESDLSSQCIHSFLLKRITEQSDPEEKSSMQRAQSNPPPPPLPPSPTLEWKVWRQSKTPSKGLPSIRAVILLSVVVSIIVAGVFSLPWIVSSFMIGGATIASDSSIYSDLSGIKKLENLPASPTPKPPPRPPPPTPSIIPFTCPEHNQTNARICRSIPPISTPESPNISPPAAPSCPEYFRWIHEDLQPWRRSGITRDMVERAGRTANFRLVVLGGRAFVQRLRPSFQTRDVFTLWGVVQLLRRYPGQLPDLELMFDTVDWPVVRAADYPGRNASAAAPPPLFRYCGDDSTLDIVFPDWSFWGWPEININPWEKMRAELKEANKGKKWTEREPYAYWKGNPAVSSARQDLLRCNISESVDWNARIYTQDWRSEALSGYKESDLSSQCIHRYKIYIEGSAWSVSEKYILACDSMMLVVKPRYYDFFTRGLMPVRHYWPVRDDEKCESIKFAVDWGNSHKRKAEAIGKEGSEFIQENLKMDYVYDYMFHLLGEYSKLQRFRPAKPRRAAELCAEAVACSARNPARQLMMESLLNSAPLNSPPCSLPPPFSPAELRVLRWRKANSVKQVEIWEQKARRDALIKH